MPLPTDNQLIQLVETLTDRVEQLEQRESMRRSRESHRKKSRGFIGKIAAASLVVMALAGTMAVAEPSVSMTCPGGKLFCFLADTPAKATQINHNFAQIKDWIEKKVGTVDEPVNIDGNLKVGRIMPHYATWSGTSGVGQGGAGIVNDNQYYKKLMIVGNNSAGGSREVGVWDNLTVNGTITSSNLTVSNKTLYTHIRDYVRTNCRVYFGWRDSCNAGCAGAPSKQGWAKADNTCGGVTGSDSECSNGWVGINTDGDVNGDDKFFIRFVCD